MSSPEGSDNLTRMWVKSALKNMQPKKISPSEVQLNQLIEIHGGNIPIGKIVGISEPKPKA